MARYDRADGPRLGEVARAAYEAAWMRQDNPIARLLMPAARVQRVWRESGHCARGEPGAQSPNADYRAEVRFFTYFALPAQRLHVTCGGWAWSIYPPRAAKGA